MSNVKSDLPLLLKMSVNTRRRMRESYSVENIFNRFKETLKSDELKHYRKTSNKILNRGSCFDMDSLYLHEIKTIDFYYKEFEKGIVIDEITDCHEQEKLCNLINKYQEFIFENKKEYEGWSNLQKSINFLNGRGL